jgi:hypothetical protein
LSLRTFTKIALLRAGARSSEKLLHYLNAPFEYAELGWWLRGHGFSGGLRLRSCSDIPDAVAADVGNRPVTYFQFGADDAKLVGRWASLLGHTETSFDVFDAADDRRGEWLPGRGRGHWWDSTAGPTLADTSASDPRIVRHAGRLVDLLAQHERSTASVLVAVFDTDHYATTKAALDFIGPRLPTQAYLFFDQLNHRADELRAFHEFLEETGTSFDLFAGNRELSCVAFRTRHLAPAERQ